MGLVDTHTHLETFARHDTLAAALAAVRAVGAAPLPFASMWTQSKAPLPEPDSQTAFPLSSSVAPVTNPAPGMVWVQAPLSRCATFTTSTGGWAFGALGAPCATKLDNFTVADTALSVVTGSQFAIAGTASAG